MERIRRRHRARIIDAAGINTNMYLADRQHPKYASALLLDNETFQLPRWDMIAQELLN